MVKTYTDMHDYDLPKEDVEELVVAVERRREYAMVLTAEKNRWSLWRVLVFTTSEANRSDYLRIYFATTASASRSVIALGSHVKDSAATCRIVAATGSAEDVGICTTKEKEVAFVTLRCASSRAAGTSWRSQSRLFLLEIDCKRTLPYGVQNQGTSGYC